MGSVSIEVVESKSDLRKFITFPDQLYKGNPYRVPQLHSFEKSTLDAKKNPAFDHCEAKYWLAYKGGKVVGRIAGIINRKANETWNEFNARFGWIDFVDDYEVSARLIETVEKWAKSKKLKSVHGPMGFSDMDLEGMLVEGFNEISTQAVIYNFDYYPRHLEKHGYSKAVDWLQFEIKVPKEVPAKIERLSKLIQEKYELKTVKATKAKHLLPYAPAMFKALNDSFKDLYGFVPLTEKQIKYYTDQYFGMIDPKFVCLIVDKKDEVVGFGLSLRSLSAGMIKAKGKLFPFGFIPILKGLWSDPTIDMLLQGVKPEFHNKGVPAIFFCELMKSYIDNGIKTAISSHALEDNTNAFSLFRHYEHRQHLRRRCYQKELHS